MKRKKVSEIIFFLIIGLSGFFVFYRMANKSELNDNNSKPTVSPAKVQEATTFLIKKDVTDIISGKFDDELYAGSSLITPLVVSESNAVCNHKKVYFFDWGQVQFKLNDGSIMNYAGYTGSAGNRTIVFGLDSDNTEPTVFFDDNLIAFDSNVQNSGNLTDCPNFEAEAHPGVFEKQVDQNQKVVLKFDKADNKYKLAIE